MTETSTALPIEIRHRHTNAVLFRSEKAKDLRAALVEAVAGKACLVGAYLGGANLGGANLGGANLGGANLSNGLKAQAGTRVAFAGPVGDSGRTVFAFIAQPNETHKKPFLVLSCGCFIGDEKAYRTKVGERYDGKDQSLYRAQCIAALTACKVIAATWPMPKAEKKAKASKAKG